MAKIRKYQIGDKTYLQRPVVMGQLGLLLPLLESIQISETGLQAGNVLAALGRNLTRALAIVLIEEGKSVRDAMSDLDARTEEIQWAMSPEMALEVIEDFFDCNPISSIAQKITGAVERIRERAQSQAENRSSSDGCSSSPVEISPGKTPFSGNAEPKTGSDGCDSSSEND